MFVTIDEKRNAFMKLLKARLKKEGMPARRSLNNEEFADFCLLTDTATRMRSDLRSRSLNVVLSNDIIVEALPTKMLGNHEPVAIENMVNHYLDLAKTSPIIEDEQQNEFMYQLFNTITTFRESRRYAPTFITLLFNAITQRLGLHHCPLSWGKLDDRYMMLIDHRILVIYQPIGDTKLNSSDRHRGNISVIELGGYLSNYLSYGDIGENCSRLPHYMEIESQKRSVGTLRVTQLNPSPGWQAEIMINPAGFWNTTVDSFIFNKFTSSQVGSPERALTHKHYAEMMEN